MSTVSTDNKYVMGKAAAIYALVVLTLLYILNYADRYILSVALQPMKVDLGLTDAQVGIVQSLFSIGVGVLSLPVTILIDRWSRRWSIGIMAILWSAGTFATGISRNFIQLLFARGSVGIGEAGFFSGGIGWLSAIFPKDKRARILTIFAIGTTLGIMAGSLGGGLIIAQTHDWRSPFWIYAIPGVILGIMTLFIKDYSTIKQSESGKTIRSFVAEYFGLFKIRAFTLTMMGALMWGMFFITFMGWVAPFLMRGYKLNTADVGWVIAGAAALSTFTTPLIGWLTDIWHKRNPRGRAYMMAVMKACNVVAVLVMILAYQAFELPIFIAVLLITFIFGLVMPGLGGLIVSDVVPIKHRSSALGLQNALMFLVGGTLGPWLVGITSDAFGGGANGLKMGFWVLFPALIVAFVFDWINSRKAYVEDSARCSDIALGEK